MIKISLITMCVLLSSCSLYDLKDDELQIAEQELDFKQVDDFDKFMKRERVDE